MTQTVQIEIQTPTLPARLYELLEGAHKLGYNWRGVWDKMSYTSKMLATEQICQDGSFNSIFCDKDFVKVIFGEEGEIRRTVADAFVGVTAGIGINTFQKN